MAAFHHLPAHTGRPFLIMLQRTKNQAEFFASHPNPLTIEIY
jgi:hypothetical protein